MVRIVPVVLIVLALTTSVAAQAFDHEWAVFEPSPGSIVSDLLPLSSPDDEVDLAQGDLDLDGWTDVAVVRKEPWTTQGKRTNVLLMNEAGVLTDRTAQFASASDVPGDQGFLSPTNDRDVGMADLDGDGWPELVTATMGQLPGEPKRFAYPRVYLNLGEDAGAWQGLQYQEARFPQLYTFDEGRPAVAMFNAVGIGDLDGDGDLDLYMAHHDEGLDVSVTMPPGNDLDDRLLLNDGNGFFIDGTLNALTTAMYETTFTSAVVIDDFNGDGGNDIVRVVTGGEPEISSIAYQDPDAPGTFDLYDVYHGTQEPYHVEKGDLDNDGRLDVVLGDDFLDRYRLNQGNDILGRVIWGPDRTFDYLSGTDESYAGNIRVGDLDNDGWDEVLVCSVDIQSQLGTRRTHLYHNLGGQPGLTDLVLREERADGTDESEWIGAVGFDAVNTLESYDLLLIDVDNDGWNDVLQSTFGGTTLFRNLTGEQVCQADLGFGDPGGAMLSMCGDALAHGGDADLRVEGAPPLAQAWLVLSTTSTPTPVAGGTLVPLPIEALIPLTADAEGVIHLPDVAGGNGPLTVFAQVAYQDGGWDFTNALQVELLP